MNIALLTIGDELLIGQVLNSNAKWLSEKLTEYGVTVSHHLTVGDSFTAIHQALDFLSSADAIIVGGGLGPTHDDLTMEALSRYFAIPLEYDAEWISKVEAYFKARNRPMAENNKKQGYLLKTATRIDNHWGTAAGQYFKITTKNHANKKQEIFVVPGVPHELKGMAEEFIFPHLQKSAGSSTILKQTLLVTGIGESALAQKCAPTVAKIKALHSSGEKNITLAFLPSSTEVRLRLQLLSSDKSNRAEDQKLFDELKMQLIEQCGADFYGIEPMNIETLLIHKLKEQSKTLAIAESCTGGLISHRLTQVPGASSALKGSLIAYHEELKINDLGIPETFIQERGIVSEQVAKAMADAIRQKWNTNFGMATTGYLGPGGGDAHASIGTVCVAVSGENGTAAKTFTFENHRERNKERAAQAALDLLRRMI